MGCCTNFMKTVLFVANVVILIIGIGVVVMGAIGASNNEDFNKLVGEEHDYKAAAYTLIGVGSFLIVFSFFGCFGAIKEIKWMLVIYSIILTLGMIILGIAGILGFLVKGAEDDISDELYKSLNLTSVEKDTMEGWDKVQESFKCCGVKNAADWAGIAKPPVPITGYPSSCCKNDGETAPSCTPYDTGCLERFLDGARYVGIIGVISAAIMFIGVIFSCAVMCKRKSVHYA